MAKWRICFVLQILTFFAFSIRESFKFMVLNWAHIFPSSLSQDSNLFYKNKKHVPLLSDVLFSTRIVTPVK